MENITITPTKHDLGSSLGFFQIFWRAPPSFSNGSSPPQGAKSSDLWIYKKTHCWRNSITIHPLIPSRLTDQHIDLWIEVSGFNCQPRSLGDVPDTIILCTTEPRAKFGICRQRSLFLRPQLWKIRKCLLSWQRTWILSAISYSSAVCNTTTGSPGMERWVYI